MANNVLRRQDKIGILNEYELSAAKDTTVSTILCVETGRGLLKGLANRARLLSHWFSPPTPPTNASDIF